MDGECISSIIVNLTFLGLLVGAAIGIYVVLGGDD